MASLAKLKQTLVESHCQTIRTLETNYMNRIHQLLQMKTVILLELQTKFYQQLNEINHEMETMDDNTVHTPIQMVTDTNMENKTLQQHHNDHITEYNTETHNMKTEPIALVIDKQLEKSETFVVGINNDMESFECEERPTPLPPSANMVPIKSETHNIISLVSFESMKEPKNTNFNTIFMQTTRDDGEETEDERQHNNSNTMECKHPHCDHSVYAKDSMNNNVETQWNVMREFKPGNRKFDIAMSKLRSMRRQNRLGNLPSLRGFMKTVHLGFPKANAVLKYYAETEMNMTLEAFKQKYMVLRQVKSALMINTDDMKQYECNYCKLCFESQCKYQQHLNGHEKEKPFECSYCKKRFIDQSILKQHIQRLHI